METSEAEVPRQFFWRVIAFVNGVMKIVDGMFYHSTQKGAEDEFFEAGDAYLRAKGVNKDEVAGAAVVERSH